MSDTIVDMPKVTQMLDAGWVVQIERGGMGGYVARARHDNLGIWERAKGVCLTQTIAFGNDADTAREINDADWCTPGDVDTEDFTPEQALTRLAYKVHGEILGGPESGGAA